jgi:hypothetical protein
MDAQHTNWEIRSACADNSGNIYVGGDFSKINGEYYWGVAKWNGLQWDSLGGAFHMAGQSNSGSNGARTLAFYNNEIYAGGNFTEAQGKPIRYIARWNGTQWDSLSQAPNASVTQMVVCNGKLYVFGNFNKIGTVNCNKMAVWDGVSWTPIWMPYSVAGFVDAVVYKGEVYVGGNILGAGSDPNNYDLIKYDGTNWVPVGGGIKGGVSFVNGLRIFNNELYVGGYFAKSAGNAGDNLMKWDGLQFKEVVAGLDAQVWNITEVPDGLIVTGSFEEPYTNILKISNQGVCGYKDTVIGVLGSLYDNSKLYFYGGFLAVNRDSTLGHVCYVNYTTQTDSCQDFISGFKEQTNYNNIKIYPNPASSQLNIIDEQNDLQGSIIEITNSLGQNIRQLPFSNAIDVSTLPVGCYFMTITTSRKSVLRSKFIRD